MHEYQHSQVAERKGARARLHKGSAEAFVEELCADALNHPVVRHPYLQRMASGDLPDMKSAIRDFCHQYYFYSAEFPQYLEAVIGELPLESHREIIRQNLAEEQGQDSTGPMNIPHTELFQRFREAAGVTAEYETKHPPCDAVLFWRDRFLEKCKSPVLGVGVGAIGIATEMIVSSVYRFLHDAVTRHTDMTPNDYLFLTLHMGCDDEHAAQMKLISLELAENYSHREGLHFGVTSALDLRHAFMDAMLARALAE